MSGTETNTPWMTRFHNGTLKSAQFFGNTMGVVPYAHRFKQATGLAIGLWTGNKIMNVVCAQTLGGKEITLEETPFFLKPLHGLMRYNKHSDAASDRWKFVTRGMITAGFGFAGAFAGSADFFRGNGKLEAAKKPYEKNAFLSDEFIGGLEELNDKTPAGAIDYLMQHMEKTEEAIKPKAEQYKRILDKLEKKHIPEGNTFSAEELATAKEKLATAQNKLSGIYTNVVNPIVDKTLPDTAKKIKDALTNWFEANAPKDVEQRGRMFMSEAFSPAAALAAQPGSAAFPFNMAYTWLLGWRFLFGMNKKVALPGVGKFATNSRSASPDGWADEIANVEKKITPGNVADHREELISIIKSGIEGGLMPMLDSDFIKQITTKFSGTEEEKQKLAEQTQSAVGVVKSMVEKIVGQVNAIPKDAKAEDIEEQVGALKEQYKSMFSGMGLSKTLAEKLGSFDLSSLGLDRHGISSFVSEFLGTNIGHFSEEFRTSVAALANMNQRAPLTTNTMFR